MSIKTFLSQRYHRIQRTWRFYQNESDLISYFPRGHFHSPLPELSEGRRIAAAAFEYPAVDSLPGIDLRVDAQKKLLLQMAELYAGFDWSDQRIPGRRFHLNQSWYKQADSICLYSMLRLFRPRRIIEVGSGFSSALMLDVNDLYLGKRTHLTFIEPNPDRLNSLLAWDDRTRVRMISQPVQSVSSDLFSELEDGDFLFIDSSHVSKIGSDVNFLILKILPQIPVGTFVHFHDIFWPFEYPAEWIAQGTAWNESYLLRTFLTFNENFEIVLWAPFCAKKWPEFIKERMPDYMINTGAAIWIRRVK